MTDVSLKTQNQKGLVLLLIFNVLVFITVMKTHVLISGIWSDLWVDIEGLVGGAALPFIAGIINGQIHPDNKARLVFLRWNNPLPGSRAFSHYMHSDPRIDPKIIQQIIGDVPTDGMEQNQVWYTRLYTPVKDVTQVKDAHRHFLFARDYTTFIVMLFITASPLAFWFMPWREASIYTAFILFQYIIASQAGRNYGLRYVTTSMAQAQAKH